MVMAVRLLAAIARSEEIERCSSDVDMEFVGDKEGSCHEEIELALVQAFSNTSQEGDHSNPSPRPQYTSTWLVYHDLKGARNAAKGRRAVI